MQTLDNRIFFQRHQATLENQVVLGNQSQRRFDADLDSINHHTVARDASKAG
jgi:hypothetical protein